MNSIATLVRKVSSRRARDVRGMRGSRRWQRDTEGLSTLEYLCKYTNFTRNEIKLMYRAFKESFPEGTVTENNLSECLAACFPGGDVEKYAHLLYMAMDADRNGQITFMDLVMTFSVISKDSNTHKLAWIFHLYDTDQDGYISRFDMQNFLHAIYAIFGHEEDEQALTAHVNQIFEKMDKNDDDLIDQTEFFEACEQDANILRGLEFSSAGGRTNQNNQNQSLL